MRRALYSYHDRCRGFLAPFSASTDDEAKRGFLYSCEKMEYMAFSPDDFSLYKVGEYDDESGELISCTPPLFIVRGFKKEVVEDGIQDEVFN